MSFGMLIPPGPIRALVATKPVDFRKYAERTVMQSARSTELRPALFSTV
jgi:hypothetical protein